jgi:CHAD domain-containing protein
LRWLAHLLGSVRDYDILRERLRVAAAPGDRQTLGKLHRILAHRHREAQEALVESLKSDRYYSLIERLRIGSLSPETTLQASEPPLIVLLPLLSVAWNKLSRAANKLNRGDAPTKFHRVRKMAKRLRYATESVRTYLESKDRENSATFIKRIKALQDILGEHQDAVVAAETVEYIIDNSSSTTNQKQTPSRFEAAALKLVSNQTRAAKKARKDFRKIWKKTNDPKVRRWMNIEKKSNASFFIRHP